jgi:hypothetical protein
MNKKINKIVKLFYKLQALLKIVNSLNHKENGH